MTRINYVSIDARQGRLEKAYLKATGKAIGDDSSYTKMRADLLIMMEEMDQDKFAQVANLLSCFDVPHRTGIVGMLRGPEYAPYGVTSVAEALWNVWLYDRKSLEGAVGRIETKLASDGKIEAESLASRIGSEAHELGMRMRYCRHEQTKEGNTAS